MAESAGSKRKRGEEDEPARLNQDTIKLEVESTMAEYAGDDRKKGKDESARLEQSERKSSEVEQARRNQDMIKLEAESTCDVFLCFRGSNSSRFADDLYCSLKADGIHVFIDDGTPDTSEELPPSVCSAKIYVPIFSKAYAYSPRCLETLALMVEHTSRSGGKKEILPVFYHVERSDVQLEKKSRYGDALHMHKQILGDEPVELWEKAVVVAGNVKGWELSSFNSEEELITSIVTEILLKLKVEHNYVPEDLIAGDSPVLSDRTSTSDGIMLSQRKIVIAHKEIDFLGIHLKDGAYYPGSILPKNY